MKNLFLILFFLLLSCSNNNLEDIKEVEYFLGTNIPTDIVNIKSSTEGLRQSIRIIDITLSKKDYDLLIKRINLKEYEIYRNNYYKNHYFKEEDKKIFLTLYNEEHRIRYAEKE